MSVVVYFATEHHGDYDPVTFEARKHERVDIRFSMRGDRLVLEIGQPYFLVFELVADPGVVMNGISEVVECSDRGPSAPEKTP